MNEWAHLSDTATGDPNHFSGVRKLQPAADQPAVTVVHLPYLLGMKLGDVKTILKSIGWVRPPDEDLVETNANSCLFAAAAEYPLRKALGFHPDSVRLAREVTAGFLTKGEAVAALNKLRISSRSVREVLVAAGII
jgi:hypothetical protein